MQWILNLNRTSENTYTGYTGSRASPFAVGATIAVHVAIGALVWMLPPGTLKDKVPDILWVHFEKAPPPKPEVVPQQDKKEQPFQRHVLCPSRLARQVLRVVQDETQRDLLVFGP